MENKRNDLGYLGIEFQYRLVHHFMDDKKFNPINIFRHIPFYFHAE